MCRQSVGRGEGSLLLCVNSGVSLLLLVVLVVLFQDSAVFHKIRDIDFVLTGAEVVVENGGIINTVCSLAISARGLSMQYLLRPVLLNAAFVFVCPRCVCVCACVCVRLCVCVPVCVCVCVLGGNASGCNGRAVPPQAVLRRYVRRLWLLLRPMFRGLGLISLP